MLVLIQHGQTIGTTDNVGNPFERDGLGLEPRPMSGIERRDTGRDKEPDPANRTDPVMSPLNLWNQHRHC